MPTTPVTKNDRLAPDAVPPIVVGEDESALRQLAVRQIERVHSFKLHAISFGVGVIVLGAVWVLTEYLEEHTWPSRFADSNDGPGTWSPWYFWVVGIWAGILAVHAVKTYAHRPPTEGEIQRELARLKSRG